MSAVHATVLLGDTDGAQLGAIIGIAVVFGATDGIKEGANVGLKVVGVLLGLTDGRDVGAKVGINVVGDKVGDTVLGDVWHIEGDTALQAPLYILLFPDIATQSLPMVTTGYDDRQKEAGSVGTVPS